MIVIKMRGEREHFNSDLVHVHLHEWTNYQGNIKHYIQVLNMCMISSCT